MHAPPRGAISHAHAANSSQRLGTEIVEIMLAQIPFRLRARLIAWAAVRFRPLRGVFFSFVFRI